MMLDAAPRGRDGFQCWRRRRIDQVPTQDWPNSNRQKSGTENGLLGIRLGQWHLGNWVNSASAPTHSTLIPVPPDQWMFEILGGAKSGAKISSAKKTMSHKKIQSPLSDWIS